MLSKPDGGYVDGPLSSPPCIFHFFLVLSKTIQALTQRLQLDCGQLQKELSLKMGPALGGDSISHGRCDFLNTACSPSWGPLHYCLCSSFPPSPLTHRHMHTHLCAHTHKVQIYMYTHKVHTGTHRHTKCTHAHKDTHAHKGTHIHTQMHTQAHK